MAYVDDAQPDRKHGDAPRSQSAIERVRAAPTAAPVLIGISLFLAIAAWGARLAPDLLAILLGGCAIVAVIAAFAAPRHSRSPAPGLDYADELIEARHRAEEANRAKSRFLAMVSHEVRTPLNGILGMTHLLERTTLSAEQESYVAAVRRSGDTLFDLVSDLLDFSAIEAGRFQLNPERGDLHRLIEEATELMSARAHEKGLDIAACIMPDTPQCAVIDHDRVRQVLFNLIGNAVKFTEAGGIGVETGYARGVLSIHVSDTGPGLAPRDRMRIFEEFEQAGNGRQGRSGVGLGLSISARIVAAMGGSIDVESAEGIGSRFTVSLPLDRPEPVRPVDGGGKHRVLILMQRRQTADAIAKRLLADGAAVEIVDAIDQPGEMRDPTHIIIDDESAGDHGSALPGLPARAAGGPCRLLAVTPARRERLKSLAEDGFDGWLVLPIRQASLRAVIEGRFAGPQPHPDASRLHQAERSGGKLEIVVAEDNPVNALIVCNVLRQAGHVVTLVEDGQALIETLFDPQTHACRFDLVITDVAMPRLDGLAALKHIRAHQAAFDLPRIPVALLTADGRTVHSQTGAASDADLYLEKPIDPVRLTQAIEHLAARR
ncbi:hybrid sensor histidine kinase/response regulator [Pararhizobium haloflavum]|uniref:hybrid sensor histidine kinase/response regulator n=1 Tax=Pararhizobium haloflavum TaxID=2037914 RepID=UPI000C1A4BE6|nr:ATP-binding protein [Pararhizobium haloflavum]